MPEIRFTLRWPDGTEDALYSPSSVIEEFFEPGKAYPMDDLLIRSRIGLERASSRVAAKYGYPCSRAMASLDRIEAQAARFREARDASVLCLSVTR